MKSNILSRRRFNGLMGSSGLLALSGCGGGGGSDTVPVSSAPPPTASPPSSPPATVAGISLLAGGLGGVGRLEARGTLARLNLPDNLAAGKDGAVWFSSVRQIGLISAEGDVDFLADFPYISISGMAANSQGVLYACADGVGVIYKLVEDGTPHFEIVAGKFQPYPQGGFADGIGGAALLHLPRAPVFDASDNLYFIDADNHAVRKLSPTGAVTTVAGKPANQARHRNPAAWTAPGRRPDLPPWPR